MNKLAVIPKNKTGGIVTGTIFAIGGLIIATILILIIVSTINGAKLIGNDLSYSTSVVNESITNISGVGIKVMANSPASNGFFTGWNATKIINGSDTSLTNQTLVEGVDYQIFSANGSIGNMTQWSQSKARITYTYSIVETQSKNAVANMTSNFTTGLDNVSNKIPTILLIIAVVFLFGALVLLVREAQNMGIGGGGGSL